MNSSCSPARTVRSRSCRSTILQPLGDLLVVGAGAVAAEQELADVGRDRVLALELQRQVLADDVAVERLGRDPVERVQLHLLSSDRGLLLGEDVPRLVQNDDEGGDFQEPIVRDGSAGTLFRRALSVPPSRPMCRHRLPWFARRRVCRAWHRRPKPRPTAPATESRRIPQPAVPWAGRAMTMGVTHS